MTGGDTNHYTTEDLLRFGIVHIELISDLKQDFLKIQNLDAKLTQSPPGRGIEARSPAWQAGILTTILPRTCWDLESCTVSWLVILRRFLSKYKVYDPKIIQSSPRREIEARSPAWQAGILTTILPRTCWDLESSILSWLVILKRIFLNYKIWMQK